MGEEFYGTRDETGNVRKSDLKRIDEAEESFCFTVLFETLCLGYSGLEKFYFLRENWVLENKDNQLNAAILYVCLILGNEFFKFDCERMMI